MVRVKKGIAAHRRRKNLLEGVKGFRWGRKSKYKAAKEALMHAWKYAYRDRRNKKREFRKMWQIKINSSARKEGLSYSRFIDGLKKKNIELDRKVLADLVENNPDIFKKVVEEVK